MPKPRNVLNAFTAKELHEVTGLSVHMINYLSREDYLKPTYDQGRVRGKVRYYSYRDLVVARVIQRLRESGVQLRRLKDAIGVLGSDQAWLPKISDEKTLSPVQWLVSNGKEVLLKNEDGFLDELHKGGQRTFAFVISLENLQDEIRERITQEKLMHYTTENRDLIFETDASKSNRARSH